MLASGYESLSVVYLLALLGPGSGDLLLPLFLGLVASVVLANESLACSNSWSVSLDSLFVGNGVFDPVFITLM